MLDNRSFLPPAKFTIRLSIVLLACSLALRVGPATERRSAATEKTLRQTLDELCGPEKKLGMIAAVAESDGSVAVAAAGLADREKKTPMRSGDRILAGSVGKMFASAVILFAVQDGELKLDDPVEKWLGDQEWYARVPNAHDITLRMLMNHSSGIREHVLHPKFIAAMRAEPDKIWKPEELVAYILDTPALFPAGKGWSYADTNYILAAMVFEKATHRRYYDDLERRILKPFALKKTIPSDRRILPGLVPGYSSPKSPFQIAGRTMTGNKQILNPQMEWTGGGVASNPADLARWATLLYEGKVLSPEMTKELLTGVDASHGRGGGKGETYGLAVQMRPSSWGITYGHDGWYPGYLSSVIYYPARHAAIAFQINTDDQQTMKAGLGQSVDALAAAVFGPAESK